jgi:inward rectifier potassium channel
MAKQKRFTIKARTDENTGFGTVSSMYGGRLVNKDGRPNIHRRGISFLQRHSWYHTMLELPRTHFLGFIFLFFLLINLVFALVYFFIGVEYLGGMVANTTTEKFIEAYFFSAQTFTTVGYGRINPTGYLTSFVAAFEAFSGLLFFALATGLFYARFSQPKAFIRFSDKAIMAPFKEGIAFMFRLTPFKNTYLTDAEIKLTLAMSLEENGKTINRFFPLPLELSSINTLNLSWTLVHVVDEKSPFYGLTREDLIAGKAEIMVFLKAFDETYSNTVVKRSSYLAEEIEFGARFLPMYHRSGDNTSTILDIEKLSLIEKADLPGVPA